MNKICLLMLATLILFFCSANSYAVTMWTGEKEIEYVQVVEHGGFLVRFTTEINPTCTHAGTHSLLIYPNQNNVTDAGVKALLSTTLLAYSTNARLDVMYDDAENYCWGRYVRIVR